MFRELLQTRAATDAVVRSYSAKSATRPRRAGIRRLTGREEKQSSAN